MYIRDPAPTLNLKPLLWGLSASITMLVFYAAIMLLTMPAQQAWTVFQTSWWLIAMIIVGFGVQVGLWRLIKNNNHHHGALPGASGAMSGTAMVACCAHHLADVLPILGFSGAALLLAQYQKPLLIMGASINLLGIAYMINLLQKQHSATHKLKK